MKKKLFTLLMLISAFVCGVSAQVTIFDDSMADWITAGAQNDSEQKTPLAVEDGTVIWVGGKLNNSSQPNAGTSTEYPNFIRFGSAGHYLQVHPTQNFSKGGKMQLTFTANTSSSYVAEVAFLKDGVETTIGNIEASGKTINTVSFDVPEAVEGDCEIKVIRKDITIFIYGIVLETNEAGPSSDATIKSLAVADNVVEPVESAYSYELPASFDGTTAEVVITPNDAKSVVTVSSDAAPNTEAGAYTTHVTIGTPVTITVTPETGAEDALTYTLSVTKAANLSSDTSLKSVTVDDVELPAGDDGNYTLDIAFAYDKPLDIVVAANDDMADAVIDQNKPTVEGGASVDVKITVTAEDQSTKDYTLKITRAAASIECELTKFSINGFIGTIDEDAKTIRIKVIKDYDFSHTPVMTVSENATAVWNKDAKSVVVTAQDGTTNATYTVNVAAESVEALSVFPTNLSFAAATYTEPVEWIYGASYNAELKDAADTNVVGGYELKKENDNVGIEAGSNVLNIYLEKCATLTVNVGATGGRYVVATVGDTECGNATLTKGVASDLVCTVDKREPVTVVIRSYKNDKKEAATGGTRIYSVNVTAPTDQPDNISNQSVENAMTVYSVDGIVYVSVAKAQVANIYGIDGRLVKVVELNEGDNTISGLSNGIYLINNKKVVIK